MMIQAGLYAKGSDPEIDAAIRTFPMLDAFLAENAPDGVGASFARLTECLGRVGPGASAGAPVPAATS